LNDSTDFYKDVEDIICRKEENKKMNKNLQDDIKKEERDYVK